MAPPESHQVPVHYLAVGGTDSDTIDTSGGILVEMCTNPACRALVPTEHIQEHIDGHGTDHVHDGSNRPVRPDNSLPPEQNWPDNTLPPVQEPPPEVSGGPPPTAGQQPALWLISSSGS